MSETLGSLVDKLSICNLRLWFAQEKMHEAERASVGVDAEVVRQVVNLNRQRNQLATQLDELLAAAVKSGKVEVDPRYKT